MANDKTYDRRINIWINGKEVSNDISSIKKEMFKLINEQARMTRGSKEYIATGAEIKKLKGVLKEHQDSISATGTAWNKLGDSVPASISRMANSFKVLLANPVVLVITAIIGALTALVQAFKSSDLGATEFAARFEQVKAILDVVRQRLIGVTDAIGHVFKGEWKEAAASMKEAFKGIGDQISSATKAAYEYQYALDGLQDSENNYLSKAAENRNKIAKLEYTAQDRTRSTEERKKALEEALAIGMEEARMAKKFAKEKLDNEINYLAGKAGLRAEDVLSFIKMNDMEQKAADTSLQTLRNNNEDKFAEIEKLYAAWIDADTRFFEENKRNISRMSGFEEEMRIEREAIEKAVEKALTNNMSDQEFDKSIKRYEEYNAKLWAKFEKTESDKIKLTEKTIEEQDNLKREQWAREQIEDQKNLEDKINRYSQFGARVGDALGEFVAEGVFTAKEASKAIIKIALDELSNLATIEIGAALIKSSSRYGPIAGPIRAAIITAIIRGAISTAKNAVLKNLWTGGFSGEGGKYEPKGVVHGGEWVANQEMVASPVTGPIIKMLENYRVNNMPGYVNGGVVDNGGQGVGSVGQSTTILGTDPEMKDAIRKMAALLQVLLRDGVRNNWTYKDVDNMRQGMDKLEDIESESSL